LDNFKIKVTQLCDHNTAGVLLFNWGVIVTPEVKKQSKLLFSVQLYFNTTLHCT